MGARSLMMALMGFAVAGGSVLAANQLLSERFQPTAAADEPEIATVIVAASDISFGQAIDSHSVTVQTWPANALPSGAFTRLADVVVSGNGEPRRAKRPLAQGEILLRSKVSEFGEKVTIVQTLGENSRAVAIKVDAVSGVGGFVTPGDRVDVILTEGSRETLKAVTILQNIRVIAVDQVADEMRDQPGIARTVTVEVTPDQSQKLALAQQAGLLSLTLRTPSGRPDDKPLDMVRIEDLLLQKSPVPEEARQPMITVRRGKEVTQVTLD